jgi:uncharacterized protein YneF (UPF0154 family)
MNDKIIAKPANIKPQLSYALCVALVTPIGLVPGIFLGLFVKSSIYHNQPLPSYLITLLLLASLVPGFLFGLCFAKKSIDKLYWQLTDTELSFSPSGRHKFPLASIDKIIIGLPPANAVLKVLQRAKSGTTLGTTVDVLSAVQPIWNTARTLAMAGAVKKNSLLICFKDGSWLPLRLFALPNGRALMDALRERCEDRVVESYNFSPEELKRLRSRDTNELIPAP